MKVLYDIYWLYMYWYFCFFFEKVYVLLFYVNLRLCLIYFNLIVFVYWCFNLRYVKWFQVNKGRKNGFGFQKVMFCVNVLLILIIYYLYQNIFIVYSQGMNFCFESYEFFVYFFYLF